MNCKKLVVHILTIFFVLPLIIITFVSCEKKGYTEDPALAKNDTLPLTEIKFSKSFHDFGDVPEGEIVNHNFTFKNTGKKPLKIYRVRSSCGCTTPEYSDKLILPGATGFIKVQYSAQGKEPGNYNKKVTVITNTQPKVHELKIHTHVTEAKKKSNKQKTKNEGSPYDSIKH